MIPLSDCKPGYLYRLRARNILYGVFRDSGDFVGIRDKFGNRYLDVEVHYEGSRYFGTAAPEEEIGPCPVTFLSTNLPETHCGKCERVLDQFGKIGSIYYEHADDHTPICERGMPTLWMNCELFDWLDEQEKRLREVRGENQ
ncbi:MAG TPA: hypothetical protein VFW94_23690 [Candidatus Acidoferrales bacterium]|nr:hypothetical protein [Candidatus Acidoferrales bacterium]